MAEFEPIIVAFACHYCAYTAADMAGTMRLDYPANVKIVKVPCTGKVDSLHLMRAMQKGADGVMVAGCLKGDCHFKERQPAGLKSGWVMLGGFWTTSAWTARGWRWFFMSAGQGAVLPSTAGEFTEKIAAWVPTR